MALDYCRYRARAGRVALAGEVIDLPLGPTAHPSFPQPDDDSTLVWRYMDLPKFLAMMLRKELFLARIDRLPDKFEGTLPRLTRDAIEAQMAIEKAAITPERIKSIAQFMVDSTHQNRSSLYVNCWRLGDEESDAMWRLYCGTAEGLAVVLPYARLRESVETEKSSSYVGLVSYIDFESDLIPAGNVFNAAMYKRKEFKYEQEARIAHMGELATHSVTAPPISHLVPWPPEEYVERVVISPYAEQWYVDVVAESVRAFAPRLASRIEDSAMRHGPYL